MDHAGRADQVLGSGVAVVVGDLTMQPAVFHVNMVQCLEEQIE